MPPCRGPTRGGCRGSPPSRGQALHRGRHHGDCQPVPGRVHQGHTLTTPHALAGIVSPRPAHADARDRLRIDDAQPGPRTPACCPAPQTGDPPHQRIKQASLQPPPEPARDGAPRGEAAGQRPPRATHPQVPSQCRHNPAQRGAPRRARWIRSPELVEGPASALSRPLHSPSPCLSGAPHAAPDAPRSTSTPSPPALPGGPV
jgi:hypothetical protein